MLLIVYVEIEIIAMLLSMNSEIAHIVNLNIHMESNEKLRNRWFVMELWRK